MIEAINLSSSNVTELQKGNKQVTSYTDTNLFGVKNTESNNVEEDQEKALLEAELVAYENELKELEAEKAAKESDKRAFESQKAVLQAKQNNIQSEIDRNNNEISQHSDEVAAMNETISQGKNEIDDLQKQYDALNKEAQDISSKMNDAIAQLLDDSNNNLEEQKALIEQYTEEAYEKVASGEIKEDEIALYVAQKTGNANIANSSSAFSMVASMSLELKALISQATTVLAQITAQQSNINNLQAQVLVGNERIAELNDANSKKYQEKKSVNKDVNNIDKEITRTTDEINVIDLNINKLNNKIATTQNKLNSGLNYEQNLSTGDSKITQWIPNDNMTAVPFETDMVFGGSVHVVNNPFVSVVNNDVDYTSLVEALDAMSKSNDIAVGNARTQANKNNQELRELFQGLLK